MSDIQIYQGDCIPEMADKCDDESCDCLITSIPFGSLFSYSHRSEDIGNNQDGVELHEGQFALHMRFAIEQFYRILRPGSVACIHIQQLLMYKVQHGYAGMRDFRGAVITMFKNHGFQAHGEVAIPKNPQAVAQRLKLHSLMFATAYRDARCLAPAMNDYVLFFRKPGEGVPVKGIIETNREVKLVEPSPIIDYTYSGKHGTGSAIIKKAVKPDYKKIPYQVLKWDNAQGSYVDGDVGGKHINPHGWFTKNDWIKWASGSWDDISEIDTLEGWRCAKESKEERHVCPLQLEPIRRCINLYTNPDDIILEPFCGIGTVPYVCQEQGRGCVAFELKESYYRMSIANVEKGGRKDPQGELFKT